MTSASGVPGHSDIARALLDAAAHAGASAADAFIKEALTTEIALPPGEARQSLDRGAALRVFLPGGGSGFASATIPSEASADTFATLARRAIENAALASSGEPPALPEAWSADGRGLGLYDPDLDAPSEALFEAARSMHALALEAAPDAATRIRLGATVAHVHLANSAGFDGAYRQTLARLDLHLDGARVVRASRSLRGLAVDTALLEALALYEERIDPRVPPSGIHEVVLSPRASAEIVSALAGWLVRPSPRSNDDGAIPPGARSPAASRGERIGAQPLTILDDGRLPGGVASAPFDGEGTRTRRTAVIERGVIRDLPRDIGAAGSGGTSTGNGVRASFREPPSLRPTNFFIRPGTASPAELLASIKQGIHISTLGRIQPPRAATSPFTVPFTGRWIDGGRPGAALAGGYLASNLREILGEIDSIGADLAFSQRGGSFGAPSLHLRRAPIRSS